MVGFKSVTVGEIFAGFLQAQSFAGRRSEERKEVSGGLERVVMQS